MEIRKVQRTGNMNYLYLPTSWCKKHKISADSKVSLNPLPDGTLNIIPHVAEKKEKSLIISINEDDPEIINKLIVACYINPTASFKINFENEIQSSSVLNQKRLISLENVEIEQKQISCESTLTVSDPSSLLRMMSRKIKNLLVMMLSNYDAEIIERYEDEIDKSKLLIDKSVISAFTFTKPMKLSMIELYYVSIISRELERIVDNIILLDKKEKKFLDACIVAINSLNRILESTVDKKSVISTKTAIDFVKKAKDVKDICKDAQYILRNISSSFNNIADVIMDWAITNQLEEKTED